LSDPAAARDPRIKHAKKLYFSGLWKNIAVTGT
jgi:hypothetical protein